MQAPEPIKRVDSVYTDSIDDVSIRLLRFSQQEDGVFTGTLKTFLLASAPHFFTASYVWGSKTHSHTAIQLNTGSLPVLSSLVPFLHMVTKHDDFHEIDWWWIDSLCINLEDGHEREKQIQIMADIYKRAKKAIVWLGEEQEEDSDCAGAIEFLHDLAGLQVAFNRDDRATRQNLQNLEFTSNCAAVSKLLFRPWWTRVWTLQEFVLPKEARLYCGWKSIGRGKFKSAIYSIFLCSTISNGFEHELVPRIAFDGAFNRRRIHQWHTRPDSHGISLISIMAYLGNHSATDSRDRTYSVLGLITERDRKLIGAPEYTSGAELQFARLVRSFWDEYGNLDIICFVHLFNRFSGPCDPGSGNAAPYWVPDWSATIDFASPVPLMASQSASDHIGNFRPLKAAKWTASYNAPGHLSKEANVSFSGDLRKLYCDGVLLEMIHGLGGLDERELRCQSFVCAQTGHITLQSDKNQQSGPRANMLPMDWLDLIARSLVLDRQDRHFCFQAPTNYVTDFVRLCHACLADEPVDWSFETWFELNKGLVFGDQTLAELVDKLPADSSSSKPKLRRPPSYPVRPRSDFGLDKLDGFLSRFHDTVRKKARRLMVTNDGIVGMAPCRAREGDVIAVLFGCNIPLVLRRIHHDDWQVIGEGYAHGFMNGEVAGLIKRGKKNTYRFQLV
ncbi:hypothetical protein NX059_008589 [Plenodomus lindquistii]|nr:hypothetical protein NX059_008589 [Plenodomus lindquistii]